MMTGNHRTEPEHKVPAGDLLLGFGAVFCLAFGLCLLIPSVPVSGPATVVVYDFLPRGTWGLVYLAMIGVPLTALVYPTANTRLFAVLVLTISSFCWFVMLSLPLVQEPHVGNALATLAWTIPVTFGVVTIIRVGFTDRHIWRPVVSSRG